MLEKHEVLGVRMSPVGLEQAAQCVVVAAKQKQPLCVSSLATHGLMMAAHDKEYRAIVESFGLLAPDGQPVRWLLSAVSGQTIADRACGTDLMERVCEICSQESIGIYLYGSTPHVVTTLRRRLQERWPLLPILGCEPSVFRALDAPEREQLVQRINASGARVLFLGLGCPLQERFAFSLRTQVQAVTICVGVAFDFHAGTKQRAPLWMQRWGLEWMHRLLHEPRRLAWRYVSTNTLFLCAITRRWMLSAFRRHA